MKNLKKIGSILMTAVMTMALSTGAFAEGIPDLNDGIAGKWSSQDTAIVQGTSVNLKKEIVAYNPNGSDVHAPVITYTYVVNPAEVDGLTVTDSAGDHTSGKAVQAPIKAGITDGLSVSSLEFDNDSVWQTAPGGKATSYDITLNFGSVSFTQPGVYRYKIEEKISADSYEAVAMKGGANDIVYLDVYVDGNLDIYGYVCLTENQAVTTGSAKINGFVNGTKDGSDKYYTYDLTLEKEVVNDKYAEGHAFPFSVTFSNPENYSSTFTISETAAKGSEGISPAAKSAPTWKGTALVRHGAAVTYTGIPAGVDVTVKETNDLIGVTYQVSSKVNGKEAAADDSLVYEADSTEVKVDTAAASAIDKTQAILIINTLLLISPTGVALRVAPFVLMMAAGAVLLLFARRRRAEAEG